jgi:hypothetical protein
MTRYWQTLSGAGLLRLVIIVSALCISYEGMSQGIMGAVTVAPEFGVSLVGSHMLTSSTAWVSPMPKAS